MPSNPAANGDLTLSPVVAGPLARPMQLPRGTGNLADLFPVVTPAPATPAAPAAGMAQERPAGPSSGAVTALTADTGVLGTGQGRLIVLLLTLAAGIAAFGIWFAASGPARKLVGSLARRRGHHIR